MCRTWQEIADTLGFKSAGAASNAVDRLVKRMPPEDLAKQRTYTAEGLRLVQATLFEALAEAKRRKQPAEVVACSRAIADVLDKHAKLVGLQVVVPQDVNVHLHQTAAQVINDAEAQLLALAASRPAGLPVIDAEVVEA